MWVIQDSITSKYVAEDNETSHLGQIPPWPWLCQMSASLQVTAVREDTQRLQAEAAGLRRALQDAELDMQRMSVSHKSEIAEKLEVCHRRCLMEWNPL